MRYPSSCWLALLPALTGAGCGPSASTPSGPIAEARSVRPAEVRSREARHFDFGTILAAGQVLEHGFVLSNAGKTPLRILDAKAESPCCSSIGPHPEAIQAGSTAQISVCYRPGFQSGRRGANFSILTDSRSQPEIRLSVSASLVPEVEILPLEGTGPATIGRGQPEQLIRVISRRVDGSGRSAPVSVVATPPMSARFVGAPAERSMGVGMVETSRDIAFSLPEGSAQGRHRLPATIRWDRDRTWTYHVDWKVEPVLKAYPATLVLEGSRERAEFDVVVRSSGGVFRITGIGGSQLASGLAPLPTDPASTKKIRLVLDRSSAGQGPDSDVVITTDLAGQPPLRLKVLVLPPRG